MSEQERDEFETLHVKGAERFGLNWLNINRYISETARGDGMDLSKHKLTLSKIAYKILVNTKFEVRDERADETKT